MSCYEIKLELDEYYLEDNLKSFEDEIEKNIKLGASSKREAIAWLFDAFLGKQSQHYDKDDHEYFLFEEGVLYSKEAKETYLPALKNLRPPHM